MARQASPPQTREDTTPAAVMAAEVALSRAVTRVAEADAQALATAHAHRTAQDTLIEANMRRISAWNCSMQIGNLPGLGGIRASDAIVLEAEANAHAAVRHVSDCEAQLQEARARLKAARDHQQLAQQALLSAQQTAYVQQVRPELLRALASAHAAAAEDHLDQSERKRRGARSQQISQEIRAVAEAAGIV